MERDDEKKSGGESVIETNVLITVVVPIYKVETYLKKCIESIRRQTYQNLEILLVDDGSPDNCPKICDEYAQIDERIQVIHKENGGLSSARNAGIDRATGEYISFVDSDDYIEANMIELLYEGILKHQCEIAICNHYVEKGDQLLMELPPVDKEWVYTSQEATKLLIEDTVIKSYAWDKLYKTELFQKVRYPNRRNYEDIATTYLLFDQANRICKLQGYEYYYQVREDSISNNNSTQKWHKNCGDIITSMLERYEYFKRKDEKEFQELALAKLIPYIITYLKLGYQLRCYERMDTYKQFLKEHKKEIDTNTYLLQKDKKISKILTASSGICNSYVTISNYIKQRPLIKKGMKKMKSILRSKKQFDFTLKSGKQLRVLLFELPCFDNLGDHAIAYAEKLLMEGISQEVGTVQVIRISGWDTVAAIKQLKKQISKKDIIICQGGGNMGNLYLFAEIFRRKVLKAFKENCIISFPQTIYFTKDKQGERELEKSKKIYNRCKNLTLLARDSVSYEYMKKEFQCTVLPMLDIVVSLDIPEAMAQPREGSILCLRSDLESNLTTQDKKKLRILCEEYFCKNLITDTVTLQEVNEIERETVLKEKWSLFGKAEVVVTDRLHGMIFALITATPCIILGNNHYKVREAYKTLAKSDYLYYVESIEEVDCVLKEIKNTPPAPYMRIRFELEFQQLYRYVVNKIKVLSNI